MKEHPAFFRPMFIFFCLAVIVSGLARSSAIAEEYVGIGAEVAMQDGSGHVVAVADNSPALQAGIVPGDLIVAVDGYPVREMTLEEMAAKIRGLVGTATVLRIIRAGKPQPVDIAVVRGVIRHSDTPLSGSDSSATAASPFSIDDEFDF